MLSSIPDIHAPMRPTPRRIVLISSWSFVDPLRFDLIARMILTNITKLLAISPITGSESDMFKKPFFFNYEYCNGNERTRSDGCELVSLVAMRIELILRTMLDNSLSRSVSILT